jgi:pimeloyl-ACP methyl ester carboxylesterase
MDPGYQNEAGGGPTTFLLVHGGMHGGWCWDPVVPLLAAPAVAMDLPGRGTRPAAHGALGIDDFVDAVVSEIEALDGPVILVGHSFGGVSVTLAACRIPERIQHLVYVACMLPEPGTRPVDHTGAKPWLDQLFEAGESSYAAEPEQLARGFCQRCSDAEIDFIVSHLTPESLGPMMATMPDWKIPATVPITWVKTLRDVAQPADQQDRSIDLLGSAHVVEIDASHDAMVEAPTALARVLNSLLD